MSAGLGFKKYDGMILCADSSEVDGYVKRSAPKVRAFGVPGEWEIAVALVGGAGLGDSFWQALKDVVAKGREPEETALRHELEDVLKVFRNRYNADDETFRVLIAVYGQMFNPTLYIQTEALLSPVDFRQPLGLAPELFEFLLDTFDMRSSSVHDAEKIAVLVLSILADKVEGVERPIHIVKYVDPIVRYIKGRESEECGSFQFGDAKKIEKAIRPKMDAQLNKLRDRFTPSVSRKITGQQ